jgi:predicted RNA-binding protein associated with RNAse of E/G family
VSVPGRRSPGDPIVLRELAAGRVWSGRPAIVVRDDPDLRMLFAPAGITIWVASDDRGNELRLPVGSWTLRPRVQTDWHALSFAWPDERFAVLALWHPDWRFWRWYVNVEDVLRPTSLGFDTTELLLDVVIEPDRRSWAWKDEDEIERALALALVTPDDAADRRRAADRGRRRVMAAEPPFDRDWRTWRPDPGWPIPELPPGWERLDR